MGECAVLRRSIHTDIRCRAIRDVIFFCMQREQEKAPVATRSEIEMLRELAGRLFRLAAHQELDGDALVPRE